MDSEINNLPLHLVIAGHVDHGKSTLIGRLLYDTESLPAGKIEELQQICKNHGTENLEWSFILDAFQAERGQAVTIDTTRIRFKTRQRNYVIIDAPGHVEFLKNMISGASAADAAILVVDALEGVQEQTRRHAYILHLLGLTQMAVVINKMDRVDFKEKVFEKLSDEIKSCLGEIGLNPVNIIPVSARHGDMISQRGDNLSWYKGKVFVETLDEFASAPSLESLPLRFPVQDVYRHDGHRIILGRVESGILHEGDKILFSPGNEEAQISTIEIWPEDKNKTRARAGESIGITLDRPLFIERGHIASGLDHAPILSARFRANIFWLSHKTLKAGNTYKIRYATIETLGTIESVERVIDTRTLSAQAQQKEVRRHDMAEIIIQARALLPLDSRVQNPALGRMVIYEGYDIAGGGIVDVEGFPDQRPMRPKSGNIQKVTHLLDAEARARRTGHHGGIFWFTGLSGAGKSTLAMAVEKALFDKGYATYVLDGDNVRHGLNADLGFSPQDRTENIRRVGHVAALMADAGLVVITAFISPYRADRERVRAASPEFYREIYLNADLATCEKRDRRGLYKKARSGEITGFTGIDSPYEEPQNPELVVETARNDIESCIAQILSYIESQVKLTHV